LGRSAVRQVDMPRRRRALNTLVTAGILLVLLFAVLGVVSAGSFVSDKLSGGSKSSRQPHTRSASAATRHETVRAQAQATTIVREAQSAGRHIISAANHKARTIVSRARRTAARLPVRPTSAPTSVAAAPPTAAVAPIPTPTAPAAPIATSPLAPSASGVDLSGLPKSWIVVAYNATFGSGPGSAGSITVTNRVNHTYRGVVRVAYARGGSAAARYSGLAPGQTEVLPLNGPPYHGGGYHIVVTAH
jgi:hypothetical protein